MDLDKDKEIHRDAMSHALTQFSEVSLTVLSRGEDRVHVLTVDGLKDKFGVDKDQEKIGLPSRLNFFRNRSFSEEVQSIANML